MIKLEKQRRISYNLVMSTKLALLTFIVSLFADHKLTMLDYKTAQSSGDITESKLF